MLARRLLLAALVVSAVSAGACTRAHDTETFVVRGRTVVIERGAAPESARMTIDGVAVPLTYHAGFAAWGAPCQFGYLPLADLAEAIITSNPDLRFDCGSP